MVPFAHGQWLAARIPGARAHLEPGAGHLTMTVTAIGRILDDLLDLAAAPETSETSHVGPRDWTDLPGRPRGCPRATPPQAQAIRK